MWDKKTFTKPIVVRMDNLTQERTSFYSFGSLGKAICNSKPRLQAELHVLPLLFHCQVNILRYAQERYNAPRAPLTTEGYLGS